MEITKLHENELNPPDFFFFSEKFNKWSYLFQVTPNARVSIVILGTEAITIVQHIPMF